MNPLCVAESPSPDTWIDRKLAGSDGVTWEKSLYVNMEMQTSDTALDMAGPLKLNTSVHRALAGKFTDRKSVV